MRDELLQQRIGLVRLLVRIVLVARLLVRIVLVARLLVRLVLLGLLLLLLVGVRSVWLSVHLFLLGSGDTRAARGDGCASVGAAHRRGPRAREPSRKRPVIVAVMSSLPSAGADVRRPTIRPMQRLRQPRAGDVVADVAGGLAALEQLAQRLDDLALEALQLGRRRRRPGGRRIARIEERADGPGDALLGRDGVDPGRFRRASTSRHRGLARARRAGPRGWGSSGTPWPARPRPRGHVVHVRVLALDGEDCAAPSRIAAVTRCCSAGCGQVRCMDVA